MRTKRQLKTRRLRKAHGGVYRKPRPTRKLKARPVGLELPRRESRLEYVKRFQPMNNQARIMNTAMTAVMNTRKKSKTLRPQINLRGNLPIRKDTTYQYLKSILLILKQIVNDAERVENIDDERYDILTQMATEISSVLPSIKQDIGMNSINDNSNNNNNNSMNAEEIFEDVEEIIEIIRSYIHAYDRALRTGNLRKIESVEAIMELVAVSIDSAIQSAKLQYTTEIAVNNSVDDLAQMFDTLRPFTA